MFIHCAPSSVLATLESEDADLPIAIAQHQNTPFAAKSPRYSLACARSNAPSTWSSSESESTMPNSSFHSRVRETNDNVRAPVLQCHLVVHGADGGRKRPQERVQCRVEHAFVALGNSHGAQHPREHCVQTAAITSLPTSSTGSPNPVDEMARSGLQAAGTITIDAARQQPNLQQHGIHRRVLQRSHADDRGIRQHVSATTAFAPQ